MKISIGVFSLVIIALFNCVSCSNEHAKEYRVGLKVFKDFDSTRSFDTTGVATAMRYRPVKIDVFLPSLDTTPKTALTWGDIMDMYEQRMNYNISIDSGRKQSLALATAIGDYLKIDSPQKLLQHPTGIYEALQPAPGKFPLIVYASSMNGSSWENPSLYDSLVRHGYIVAVVSSVGKFPGYMSEAIDLQEQVEDILFAIEKMKAERFVDTARIGLLSWSLGGTAIAKAAMLSREIDCLLSFDGTEIHYYGFDTSWDRQYNQIMQIKPFDPAAVNIPYMYLSSEHPAKVDSIYVFPDHINSREKYFLKFKNAIHENFSELPVLARGVDAKLSNIDSGRHAIVVQLTLNFFDDYLKHQNGVSTRAYIAKLVADKPGFVSGELPRK